jgi:hypothetical protein
MQPYILLTTQPTVHSWWAIWSSTVVLPHPPKLTLSLNPRQGLSIDG